MNLSLKKLTEFLIEDKVEVIPWIESSKIRFNSTLLDQVNKSMSQDLRPFHYLKSTDDLGCYADDFGFQWTNLYDDYRKSRNKHLEQFLRLGINPNQLTNKTCLDVGCGLGRLSEICLGKSDLVFGVDLSNAVREAARVIKSEKFVPLQASADNLPLKDCSFDFVYCWGVLHHTQNPEKTLAELWRVLKPGGVLAIWVYKRNDWYLKRSLLSSYYSALDEQEMLAFSNTLTSLAHSLKETSPVLAKQLCNHLCFSIKSTKENTRHLLYDGLGPAFHYLLDSNWFEKQSKNLNGLKSFNSKDNPFTVALYHK